MRCALITAACFSVVFMASGVACAKSASAKTKAKKSESRPEATLIVKKPDLLIAGRKAAKRGRSKQAAAKLFTFMQANPRELPEYEEAEYYLGLALNDLGFPHAALELWVNVARGRRDARLLAPAVTAISAGVLERPYDATLMIDRLLADTEFGYLPNDADDFVKWHQGRVELAAGYTTWASTRIAALHEGSPWWYLSQSYRGVELLARNNPKGASELFESLASKDLGNPDLQRRVELTLARLAYESGNFRKALTYYENIRGADPVLRATIMLERSWCYYRLGDPSRALGLIAMLESPSFMDVLDTERDLLRALIYRDLCHFEAAQGAVDTFRSRFGTTIEALRNRTDMGTSKVFRGLTHRLPKVAERLALVQDMESERKRVSDMPRAWKRSGLSAFLNTVYKTDTELAQVAYSRALEAVSHDVADELIDADEQMSIMSYEAELARNRRAKDAPPRRYDEGITAVPMVGEVAFFAFDGEYWSDEWEAFRVVITSKCEEVQ